MFGFFLNFFICLFVCLFSNYSQIGLKGLNFLGFDGGHPWDIIMKFDEYGFVL